MLKDLAKKKEKDTEKPLPLMNQVVRRRFLMLSPSHTYGIMKEKTLNYAAHYVYRHIFSSKFYNLTKTKINLEILL